MKRTGGLIEVHVDLVWLFVYSDFDSFSLPTPHEDFFTNYTFLLCDKITQIKYDTI